MVVTTTLHDEHQHTQRYTRTGSSQASRCPPPPRRPGAPGCSCSCRCRPLDAALTALVLLTEDGLRVECQRCKARSATQQDKSCLTSMPPLRSVRPPAHLPQLYQVLIQLQVGIFTRLRQPLPVVRVDQCSGKQINPQRAVRPHATAALPPSACPDQANGNQNQRHTPNRGHGLAAVRDLLLGAVRPAHVLLHVRDHVDQAVDLARGPVLPALRLAELLEVGLADPQLLRRFGHRQAEQLQGFGLEGSPILINRSSQTLFDHNPTTIRPPPRPRQPQPIKPTPKPLALTDLSFSTVMTLAWLRCPPGGALMTTTLPLALPL